MSRRLFAYCGPRKDHYTSQCNIDFIQDQLIYILGVKISECSIRMVMKNIRDDPNQYEVIELTNDRVINYIAEQYRHSTHEGARNRNWAQHFKDSQQLINVVGKTGPDFSTVRLANRYGECRVGGSLNFHFT